MTMPKMCCKHPDEDSVLVQPGCVDTKKWVGGRLVKGKQILNLYSCPKCQDDHMFQEYRFIPDESLA